MGKSQRFVTTRFLCIVVLGGCALLTICPKQINAAELTETQRASTGEPGKKEISPAALLGLGEQQTTELLGPATTTESRAPANIWRYKNSRCELELVFYMEMRTGLMRTSRHVFEPKSESVTDAIKTEVRFLANVDPARRQYVKRNAAAHAH